jgi:hypothetical protein
VHFRVVPQQLTRLGVEREGSESSPHSVDRCRSWRQARCAAGPQAPDRTGPVST